MLRNRENQQSQWQERIALQAAKLLKDSPSPQREMAWAENRLSEANLFSGNQPDRRNPSRWAEQVIALNPDLTDQSLPWLQEKDSHPEQAETFESLILSLIPSESGL